MERREFLETTVGAVVIGALGACIGRAPRTTARPMLPQLDAAKYRATRRRAITGFGAIAYIERGAGEGALFLHGFPLNGFQWRGAIARLGAYRRCIAPDLLGLGYSDVPAEQSVAPDAQVAMLAELLDHLALPAVDLVASDSGGAVAQLFLARYPHRVRTLLLTNCDTEIDSPPQLFLPIIAAARAGRFADAAIAPALADKARARLPRDIGGLAYTNPAHLTDEVIEYYYAPLVSSPVRKRQLEAYAVALAHNPLAGIEALLRRADTPVRIIWGTGDTVFSKDSPDYLDRILPQSRGVRRVPGAKLFFPEEEPDLIAEEARRLWGV